MFISENRAAGPPVPMRQSREASNGNSAFAKVCPHCGGNLTRIHRRPVDRLLSVFVPARRFRCVNFRCIWEGNVRRSRCTVDYGAQVPV